MNYQALARQWRPCSFSELLGQDHVVKPLINSLNQNRLHHAYLFTGTRGVGKTSIARLLAKALNCEQAISADPCLKCDSCLMIEQGRFIDLIEVDGASRTRVEDTRDLLENVQYVPTQGRFKIYLIDEVHMLSQHSFNALLKTLEEPPSHVKFILATTEPKKLPVTVLSRCLQFHLKHLPIELISEQLKQILQKEQILFEEESLYILARAAKGSMRDALSLLEQAIPYSTNKMTTEEVKQILGYTQKDYAIQILTALADSNPQELISLSRQVGGEGGHFRYVLEELLTYLHQVTVNQHLVSNAVSSEIEPEIKKLAEKLSPEEVQLFYQIGIKSSKEIHLAPTPAIGFEMTLLRMLTFKPDLSTSLPSLPKVVSREVASSKVVEKQSPVDNKLHSEVSTGYEQTQVKEQEQVQPVSNQIIESEEPSSSIEENDEEKLIDSKHGWSAIVTQLNLKGFALNAINHTALINKTDSELTLEINQGHAPLFTSAIVQQIEEALTAYYNQKIKINLAHAAEINPSSPARKKEIAQIKNQKEASQSLEEDSFFQQIKQELSADVVKNSILYVEDKL